MLRQILFLLLLTSSLLVSCAPSAGTYKVERYTLGTYVQLELIAGKNKVDNFLKQFDQLSEQQTKDLYAWGNGELVAINKNLKTANCTSFPLSGDMLALLIRTKELSTLSSYLFEPTIKPLVELWGFHRSEEMRDSPPNDADIQTQLNHYGNIQDLQIKAKTICAEEPIELDLGGIAKGWAAHTAVKQLQSNKIEHAMIGLGGDLIALGKKSDGTKWKVGLKNPDINWDGFDAPAIFAVGNDNNTPIAIFTSGDYERQFEHNGRRSHHILDPRTGYPNTEVRSVTVIHSDPVLADAAATALHVAGKDWQKIAKQMNLNKVLVLFPNKKAQITPLMADLTTWLDQEYTVEILN